MGALQSTISAVIANGESLSGAVYIGCKSAVGIEMPAAWTAAGLTFQVSTNGSTFRELYDDVGNAITATVAASEHVDLDPNNFKGAVWLKIRSGTSGVPVNQGGARTLGVVKRQISPTS